MAAWLGAMSPLQQVFAYIALGGSFALVLQLALLLAGAGHGDADGGADTSGLDGHEFVDLDGDGECDFDMDHDHGVHDIGHDHIHGHDHDALRPLTVRGAIAFLAIFGWSGLILSKMGAPGPLAALLGSGAGVLAMVLMAMALRAMYNLQQAGNLDPRNAVGAVATVYITIPAARAGRGKVTVLTQERLAEWDAVTDADRPLRTGARAVVVGAGEDGALVVLPAESERSSYREE